MQDRRQPRASNLPAVSVGEARAESAEHARLAPTPAWSSEVPSRIQVWDLPIRLFHWLLTAAVVAAWFSAGHDAVVHYWAGYTVAGLVTFRIWWGVAGSRFARFSDFVRSPVAVWRFVRDAARFQSRRYIGHDPLGALLVLAMLVLLVVICATGWLMPAKADEEMAWVRDLHQRSSNVLLGLIPFHLLGVLISGWLHNENLIASMITGWKRLDHGDELPVMIRSQEQRLLDRIRAIEALAVMALLSGGALALGLWLRDPDVRTAGFVRSAMPATGQSVPVMAVATAPAPTAAGPAQPSVTAPAAPTGEREQFLAELREARAQALRDVAAAKVDAERDFEARLKSVREQSTAEAAQRVREARDQALNELKQTAIQLPRAAAEPAVRPSSSDPAGGEGRLDDAAVRRLIAFGNVDGSSILSVLSSGGRLFDKWYAALGKAAPKAAHPLWPKDRAAASAGDTWRCASCHGFDYRGDPDSARLNGAGIPFVSIRAAERTDMERIVAVMGDARHGFTDELIPRGAKIQLAMFLSKGQYTAARYYGSDGRARGSEARGKDMFASACASCHGFDGKLAVSGAAGAPLGAVAAESPAEVYHKVRNGHPGAAAAALRPFPLSTQTDVLAYIQSLPRN